MKSAIVVCDTGTKSIHHGHYPKYRPGEHHGTTIWVGRDADIQTVLQSILQHAGGRPIHLLRLFGHGHPGHMQLGKDGLDFFTADVLGVGLADKFAPGGRIEVRSCEIAAPEMDSHGNFLFVGDTLDSPSEAMLQSMANYSGAEVWAGMSIQNAMTIDFTGPVLKFKPNASEE